MADIIHADLAVIANRGYERLSMGLKPSGPLHIGTALPFLLGVLGLESNSDATFDIGIMDLDFDRQRGRSYQSFLTLQDPSQCHDLMKEHTEQEVHLALEEITNFFNVDMDRVHVYYFSDITENPRFQEFLRYLFVRQEGRRLIRTTVTPELSAKATSLLSPICGSCGYSSTRRPKIVQNEETLWTKCYNDECSVEDFSVQLTQPRTVNLFYLVDPIRDLIPNGRGAAVDLHIFGGDYGKRYGVPSNPKAKRVLNLMIGLRDALDLPEEVPDIYIGPMITFNGDKVGKSKRNDYQIRKLREQFPDWVNRLHDLLLDHPNETRLELSTLSHYFG